MFLFYLILQRPTNFILMFANIFYVYVDFFLFYNFYCDLEIRKSTMIFYNAALFYNGNFCQKILSIQVIHKNELLLTDLKTTLIWLYDGISYSMFLTYILENLNILDALKLKVLFILANNALNLILLSKFKILQISKIATL